jgi:nucleoside phosphorylase
LPEIQFSGMWISHFLDLRLENYLKYPLEKSNSRFFKTDSELLEKALKWNPGGFKVVQGRIITGDSFFTQTLQSDKADLIKKLGAYAVDMEGAAAGAAAGMYGIPFFLARVISDTSSGKKPRSFKSFMNYMVPYGVPSVQTHMHLDHTGNIILKILKMQILTGKDTIIP